MSSSKVDLTKKIVLLAIMCVLLILPLLFVENFVEKRSDLYKETARAIGAEWGKEQIIATPYLSVPYYNYFNSNQEEVNKKGEVVVKTNRSYRKYYAHFYADNVDAKVVLKDEIKKRGIYKTAVYNGDVVITGTINLEALPDISSDIGYNEFEVLVPISEIGSLTEISTLEINGVKISAFDGTTRDYSSYIIAKVPSNLAKSKTNLAFKLVLKLRGSGSFAYAPIGMNENLNITSTWADPSFSIILPDNKTIMEDGFSADWRIMMLSSTNYSSQHETRYSNKEFSKSTHGYYSDGYDSSPDILKVAKVGLTENITQYRLVERTVKYGILFVLLSIVTLLVFDILGEGRKTHIVQYAIVAASLVMFYLLLLSFSEYISFLLAYLIAAVFVVIPIVLYIYAISKAKGDALGIGIVLTGLYLVLFSIIQLENLALIAGSILVMIAIYVLMYVTRNILRTENKQVEK